MTMNIHEESSLRRSSGNSSRLANEPGKTKGGMWSGSIMPLSLLPSSRPLLTHGVWQAQNQGRVAWVLGLVSNLQVSD